MFGAKVANDGGLTRVFPTPSKLANAPLERAGVMPSRAATIRQLAGHAADGSLAFNKAAGAPTAMPGLEAIPSIGGWTTAYIAMRAFGEPDAFPSGDLILRRAAGGLTARELERRSQAWRPWRAYAVMLLWQNDAATSSPAPSSAYRPRSSSAPGPGRP